MSNFIYFIVIYFLFNLNGFCSLGFNTQDTIYNSRTQLLDSITQYSENPDSIVSATNKVIDADAYPDAETNTITYYINDDTSAISYNEGNELVYKKTKEGIDYSRKFKREETIFSSAIKCKRRHCKSRLHWRYYAFGVVCYLPAF
ncbi:MAG: hypothetical protein IPJ79_14895 [Bacteroidetes bacterium]|nr:hypothetical protein [Bacteroidota bacterium]